MEKHGRTEKFFLLLSLQLPSSKKFETWQAVCPSFYTIRYFTSRYVTVTSWLHHCYIMATSLLLRRWLILQDQVTASLKKHLLMKNSLSYEPLLE